VAGVAAWLPLPLWLWLLAGIVGILSGTHGYSISRWQALVDEQGARADLWGQARAIRSDDYAVGLPLAFYQSRTGFHPTARGLYFGQSLILNSYNPPIRHWSALFRPHTWGYWISPDVGMAWAWWTLSVLLVMSSYAFVRTWTPLDPTAASLVALAFYWSPFVQFWSLIAAPFVVWSLGVLVGMRTLTVVGQGPARLLASAFLAYSSVAFLLHVYPGFQVPLGWVILAFFLSLAVAPQRCPRSRLAAISLIGALALGVWAAYLWEARSVIQDLAGTQYPGLRRYTGGRHEPLLLFRRNAVEAFFHWPLLGGNVSESAGFFLLSPYLLATLLAWKAFRTPAAQEVRRELGCALAVALAVYAWQVYGFPPLLRELSLMDRALENRTVVAHGVVELVLLASAIHLLRNTPGASGIRARLVTVALFAVSGSVALLGVEAQALQLTSMAHHWVLALSVLWACHSPRAWLAPALLLVLNLHSTLGFNPLVRGGYDSVIARAEVSRALLAYSESGSRWLVMNDRFNDRFLAQLPGALGLASFSGVQFTPAWDFWRALDPEQRFRDAYNRYGLIWLSCMPEPAYPRIWAAEFDVVAVRAHPTDPRLLSLPFSHVLVSGDEGIRCLVEAGALSHYEVRAAARGRFWILARRARVVGEPSHTRGTVSSP
jgi:hypothetical protein